MHVESFGQALISEPHTIGSLLLKFPLGSVHAWHNNCTSVHALILGNDMLFRDLSSSACMRIDHAK